MPKSIYEIITRTGCANRETQPSQEREEKVEFQTKHRNLFHLSVPDELRQLESGSLTLLLCCRKPPHSLQMLSHLWMAKPRYHRCLQHIISLGRHVTHATITYMFDFCYFCLWNHVSGWQITCMQQQQMRKPEIKQKTKQKTCNKLL